MCQVSRPLKVTGNDTADIHIKIGKNSYALRAKDLVRLECDGAIGGFDDKMCVYAPRVFSMNGILHRRWKQKVAGLFDAGHVASVGFGTFNAKNAAGSDLMLLKCLNG